MKSNIYRYIGVVLVIVGIILSATGITINNRVDTDQDRYSVETIEALDDEVEHISNERYDDKIVNTGIGSFMVILGTFFLTGHYLMIHRERKSAKKATSE